MCIKLVCYEWKKQNGNNNCKVFFFDPEELWKMWYNGNELFTVIDFNILSKGFSKWIKIILLTKMFFHSLFKKGVSGNVLNTRPQNVTTKSKLKWY